MKLLVFLSLATAVLAKRSKAPPPPEPSMTVVEHISDLRVIALLLGVILCLTMVLVPAQLSKHFATRHTYVVALAINVVAVSLPGRFDGSEDILTSPPWPTLFNPAGFAFAIWGVIYLGELVGTVSVLRSEPSAVAVASSPAWLAANCGQALWCLSFRQWALTRMWLSSLCLIVTAACLYRAQRDLHAAARAPSPAVAWPRSLHLGWVTAASLVNANAWVGLGSPGTGIACAAAILSVVVAALAGAGYAARGLPAACLAVAWAINAVGLGEPVGPDARVLGDAALAGIALAERSTAVLLVGVAALSASVADRIGARNDDDHENSHRIRHHVLIQLKAGSSDAVVDLILEHLRTLPAKIEQIKNMEARHPHPP